MSRPRIGIAGMTHLGLNTAAAAAARAMEVIAFDPDPARIAAIAAVRTGILEPGLDALLSSEREHMTFEADPAALADCPLVVVAPDVATDDRGQSDLGPLRALIAQLDDGLPKASVMVILSQVPPGFTRALKLASGRPLYYQVETLIFGDAVERALHPERFIIGCANPAEALPGVYEDFLKRFDCPRLPMRYESAELAKISINCCLVAAISVANALAGLCEEIGADWSEIQPALKLDRRIGPHAYLAPGLGLAGGNLERDLATVVGLSAAAGTDARVVQAFIESSNYRRDWVLRLMNRRFLPDLDDPAIALWGLAYKKDTHSTKNSPALALIDHLQPYRVASYDPVVPGTAASALAACQGADILAIMTPWDSFRDVALDDIAAAMRGRVVIDPYGVISKQACASAGLDHYSLGR